MKLKRLDIHGFKSFYHRTTVVFDAGITAVVGPNGCGKSNIVDSIKWVMGEQGAKNLRGGAMEDVLFAGSGRRGPMGMCEVRLTFDNDGTGDVPQRFRDVAELAIERRLERSKGSDYRINKQRCRLADIQELVAGTGVGSGPGGRRAYAIIEQGQIGRIVGAKADERRLLIEEAAGITRFRARRRVAERKMAETELNLERVDDIVGEIETQQRSLRRQAKKAERFQAYRTEAREIAMRVTAAEHTSVARAHDAAVQAVRAAEAGGEDVERALTTTEAAVAAAELAEKQRATVAQEAAEALARAEGEVRIATADKDGLAREAKALSARLDGVRTEMALAESRQAELRREHEAARAGLAALDAGEAEAEALAAAENAARAAEAALVETRAKVESLRRLDAEEAARLARLGAEAAEARRRLTAVESEAREVRGRVELAERLAAEAAQKAVVAGEAAAAAENAVGAAASARDASHAELEAARASVRVATEALREAEAAKVAVASRLDSLRELEARREGLSEGVEALLNSGLDGIDGRVVDAIQAPAEYEAALAAALGPRLGGLVLSGDTAAALAFLVERGGRAWLATGRGAVRDQPAPRGSIGRLDQLVEAPLLAPLLSRFLVADGPREDWDGPVVTLDGQRIEPSGVEGGGPTAEVASLSRAREIRELESALATAATRVDDATREAGEARSKRTQAEDAARAAGQAVHRAEVARAETRKDRDRTAAEATRTQRSAEEANARASRVEAAVQGATDALGGAEKSLAEAQSARTDRGAELAAADQAARGAEADRDAAISARHEARTAVVAKQERRRAAEALVERLQRQLAEVNARKARDEGSRSDAEKALSSLAERRVAVERQVVDLQAKAASLATALGDRRTQRDQAEAETKAAREAAQAARAHRDQSRETLAEARLQQQATELRREHLETLIAERFQLGPLQLRDLVAELPSPTAEDRERLEQLETLIERMGDVNVNAIAEYEAITERLEFLTTQRQDLLDALTDLRSAIDQINRTTRRLFKETFEAVNAQFKTLFPRLFRGGEARLELTQPEDLLRTGIEMLVQPPGKKVQNVSLLSGGEKAMCALALVFAVFRVKPSPFCLLDEVDAPLDDANIARFNEVVREMARESQVLLITHNKRTMEIADVLYGITMEEQGVSKLVSVRMT